MHVTRVVAVVAVVAALSTCGDDDDGDGTTTVPPAATSPAPTTAPATTTSVAPLGQPAVWPAAGVVFATPEEAAADFVTKVLGVPPVLGEFRQGDARSGEIEVLSPAEGGGAPAPRSLLFLRRLGPADGWFVLGAASDAAFIASPESAVTVPAGPLTVEGRARGYEATVIVSAFRAGDATTVLDSKVTMGGAETAEPFTVTLDLSGAAPGDVVALLVRGDTGLETDPGDFGAIAVTVG